MSRLTARQPMSSLLALLLPALILSLLTCGVDRVATTHIMTEGFVQYLLSTGRLVKRYTGHLDSGQFSLVRFDQKPPLLLVLHSLQGDADLYVSGFGKDPSLKEYELKSENLSLDLVFVPDDVLAPISAMIYASPQCCENTSFALELYRHDALLDDYSRIRDELDMQAKLSSSDKFDSKYQSGQSHSRTENDSETAGSFLYQLFVQIGRIILFLLEIMADA